MTFVPPFGPPVTSTNVYEDSVRADLLERRTVVLMGELDEVTAGNIATQLIFLDGAGDDDVYLRITSAGGSLAAAASLIDVIDNLGVPVNALATRAEGPALAVLAVCDHRAVTPHATLRMVEPDVQVGGDAATIVSHLEHYRATAASLWARVSESTRLTPEHLAEEFAAGRFLSPADAQAYGFVDEIANPPAEIRKMRRPMGFRPPGSVSGPSEGG
jgi:ATP-dependent Clp protease protease subunit